MPPQRQKAKYETEEAEAEIEGHNTGSNFQRALEFELSAKSAELAQGHTKTPLEVLTAFNASNETHGPQTLHRFGPTFRLIGTRASLSSTESVKTIFSKFKVTVFAATIRSIEEVQTVSVENEDELESGLTTWAIVTCSDSEAVKELMSTEGRENLFSDTGLNIEMFELYQTHPSEIRQYVQQHTTKLSALASESSLSSEGVQLAKSLMIFETSHPVRLVCAKIRSSIWFDRTVILTVLINCILLAVETPEFASKHAVYFDAFYAFIFAILSTQLLLDIIIHGLYWKSGPTLPYLQNSVHILDLFVITSMAISAVLRASSLINMDTTEDRVLEIIQKMAPMLILLRIESLRRLLSSFAAALPSVGGIMVLLALFWAIFGIIGVEYFGGGLYRCVYKDDIYMTVPVSEVHNITQCLSRNDTVWANPPWNFDNIFSSFVTLFYLCINAGWLEIAESTLDITEIGSVPVPNQNPFAWIYFLAFHMIFSFFLLNLFIGVLSSAFAEKNGTNLTTSLQQRWIRVQAMLSTFQPAETTVDQPRVGAFLWRIRLRCWFISENHAVESLWTAGILLNVLVLTLDHYPASSSWEQFTLLTNTLCLVLFSIEILIKLMGFGLSGFMQDNWRKMDLVVVIGCWATRFFGVKSGVGVVRAFRTVRLVLLVKRMPGLMALMNTVVACIGPAINIGLLCLFVFYIYAVIGMKLFGNTRTDMPFYNDQNNFETFGSTMRLLFQLVNGQDLKTMITDLGQFGDFGWQLPFLYLATFFFLVVFICVNLFVVTVLDNFANLSSTDDTMISVEDLDGFTAVWRSLTYERISNVQKDEVDIENIETDTETPMTEQELEIVKYERDHDSRLRKWAEFRRQFPLPGYVSTPMFHGWIRQSFGLISSDRFHWIDGDCTEPDSQGHLCLNWFSEGSTQRDLERMYEKNQLVLNRVQVKNIKTNVPPAATSQLHASKIVQDEQLGKIDKMAAALSGRGWLVSIANAQIKYPGNAMAANFSLPWYDQVLGDKTHPVNIDSIAHSTIGVRLEDESDITVLQARLRQCIVSGSTMPHSTSAAIPGCFACEADDYELFWPLFSRIIAQIHGIEGNFVEPDANNWPEDGEHAAAETAMVVSNMNDDDASTQTNKNSRSKKIEKKKEKKKKQKEKQKQKQKKQKRQEKDKGRVKNGAQNETVDKDSDNIIEKQRSSKILHKIPDKSSWDLSQIDVSTLSNLPKGCSYDLSSAGVAHMPVRFAVSRNLVGFSLAASMQKGDRLALEDVVYAAISRLMKQTKYRGRYVSLTPGHPNEISETEHTELAEGGLMFPGAAENPEMEAGGLLTDWPQGRGCWISKDERTSIWVGYEDHITINAGSLRESDFRSLLEQLKHVLNVVESTDAVSFRHNPQLCGYITSSLFNCGTGMFAEATIAVPNLTKGGTTDRLLRIIRKHDLDLVLLPKNANSATDAWELSEFADNLVGSVYVGDDGEIRVAVQRTFAITEASIAAKLFAGIKVIWDEEQNENPVKSTTNRYCGMLLPTENSQSQHEFEHMVHSDDSDSDDERTIELEVIPIRAPTLQRDTQEITVDEITETKAISQEIDVDGKPHYGLIVTVVKTDQAKQKLTFLYSTLEDRDAWLQAVANARSGVYTGEARQGQVLMPSTGWGKAYSQRHCTISGAGLLIANTSGTVSMRLIASSWQEKAAWMVALKWLEGNCVGKSPRSDPRMYPGGIPPKPLTRNEWSILRKEVGVLDLPFNNVRKLLRLLQNRGLLKVTDAFSRDYVLYTSFQLELHAYRTALSDTMQRASGIERSIQACDGLNFHMVLKHLCLAACGKTNSLSYREQMEQYSHESEFIAARMILTAVGAWVAVRARQKWGDAKHSSTPHPAHAIWRRNQKAYIVGVIAVRNQRLRILTDLMRAARKTRPAVVQPSQSLLSTETKISDASNNASIEAAIEFHNPIVSSSSEVEATE